MPTTFFDSLKSYVGFTDASSAALRELHPIAAPHFEAIIDDFYAAIEGHAEAQASIAGGPAQIARLKRTLMRWLDTLLLGPHDESYYLLRARIGRVHVRIDLPQALMFTAMNRIRSRLLEVIRDQARPDSDRLSIALNQMLDLELAIMLETYREDLVAKNRGAERLATIGHFAASIGHELRNPLAVMESSLFLLRQHLGPEAVARPEVAKHLDRIGGEIGRANKTIHDLLDLARNRPPRRKTIELRALVHSAEAASLLPAGVRVKSAGVPPGLTIDVDADQFRQVLVNLFTNATQAMAGRGTIEIAAEGGPPAARIRVSDDGPGIDAEARHRLFEALFTTKAKGTGLGLALCRRILEAHGGSIELVPSELGASFLLTVPAAT
ncbi:MAG TPA: protoglobin domain-containing protein [Polyangia bacterium]|nr:protoglobin domain-containing protein [Polyangia bacterium]